MNGLSRGISIGRITIDGNGREHVEAVDVVGAFGGRQRHELRDGCHLSACIAHLDVVERLNVGACTKFGLHDDTIDFTKAVEVGRIQATKITLQSGEHIARRDASAFALRSIDVDDVLWELGVEVGLRGLNFWTLVQFGNEVGGNVSELGELSTRAVLEVKRESVGHTVPHNHWRLEEEDLRVFEGFLRFEQQVDEHHFGTLCNGVSLFPRFEFDEERTIRRALTSHEREPRNDHGVFDQRRGHHHLFDLLEHFVCAILRGAWRHGHHAHQSAGVFCGNKGGGGGVYHPKQTSDGNDYQTHREPGTANEVVYILLISLQDALIPLVESGDETVGE